MCPQLINKEGDQFQIFGEVNVINVHEKIDGKDGPQVLTSLFLPPNNNEEILELDGTKGYTILSSDTEGSVNDQPPPYEIRLNPEVPLCIHKKETVFILEREKGELITVPGTPIVSVETRDPVVPDVASTITHLNLSSYEDRRITELFLQIVNDQTGFTKLTSQTEEIPIDPWSMLLVHV